MKHERIIGDWLSASLTINQWPKIALALERKPEVNGEKMFLGDWCVYIECVEPTEFVGSRFLTNWLRHSINLNWCISYSPIFVI
jgi:hypothetical protein